MKKLRYFWQSRFKTRQAFSEAIVRVLVGLVLFGGCLIISNTGSLAGVPLYIKEVLGEFIFNLYLVWMGASGLFLIFLPKMSVTGFFVATLPFLFYVGYGFAGFVMGRWNFTAVYFYLIMYILFLANYWGYHDD